MPDRHTYQFQKLMSDIPVPEALHGHCFKPAVLELLRTERTDVGLDAAGSYGDEDECDDEEALTVRLENTPNKRLHQ